MKRREFLAGSCLGAVAPLVNTASARGAEKVMNKELYDLRLYRVDTAEKADVMDGFFRTAAIPALNRLGVKPVGVFRLLEGDKKAPDAMGPHDFYVLLPHTSAESLITATAKLIGDAKFMTAGAAVHNAPKSDPVYRRIESSLLLAFDETPKLDTPARGESRQFQLRIYESHNQRLGQKKIEMFNAGGELAVFALCGMPPVFFGEAITGSRVPNLTYMLGFENQEARLAAWGKFLKHPGWLKLKGDPQYKDTVSNITNLLLRPAPYSQI